MKTTPNPLFVAIAEQLNLKLESVKGYDEVSIDQNRATFVTPEGNKFYASADGYGYKGKIKFMPSWPEHVINESMGTRATSQSDFNYNQACFNGVMVSMSKSADQIVKDLNRRFFPEVKPLWEKAVAYCARQEAHYKSKACLSEEVTALLKPFGYGKSNVRAEVHYQGSDYTDIRISDLKIEQIRKLAEFLHTL